MQSAFERSAEVTTGRMEGLIEVSGLDPSQGFTEMVIPFGGAFDNASGNFSFYMDMTSIAAAAGDELPPEFADLFGEMEVRQIGDTAYLKFPLFTALFGAETPWISMPAEEGDVASGFMTTSPANPSDILGSFEDAGATVEVIGTETVNGVNTTHYRAVFDMEALLAGATPEERAGSRARAPSLRTPCPWTFGSQTMVSSFVSSWRSMGAPSRPLPTRASIECCCSTTCSTLGPMS